MMDDFPTRWMAYELCGYRQAREEYEKFFIQFGTNPMWQAHFLSLRGWLPTMEKYLSITPEQKADPGKTIEYWYAPYRLMKKATKSKTFLEFLEKWIYGETSAQAHLNPAGLFSVGTILLSDLAPEGERQLIDQNLEQYTFRHFSRNLATVLAITSEIENFCQLGNREALVRMWVTLAGHAEEAKEVYERRYQAMLMGSLV
jgi:hypothetical protein